MNTSLALHSSCMTKGFIYFLIISSMDFYNVFNFPTISCRDSYQNLTLGFDYLRNESNWKYITPNLKKLYENYTTWLELKSAIHPITKNLSYYTSNLLNNMLLEQVWQVTEDIRLINPYSISSKFSTDTAPFFIENMWELTKTKPKTRYIYYLFEPTHCLLNNVWGIVYFFFIFYCATISSIVIYVLPQLTFFNSSTLLKNTTNYLQITTYSLYKFFLTPLFILTIINTTWISFTVYAWYGQLSFSHIQHAIPLLCSIMFMLICYIYFTTLVFNTKEVFEFMIIVCNTLVWIFFLFCANNIFTTIFFIEMLASLIILVFITSTFTSAYNFDLTNLSKNLYFHSTVPMTILNSLIFLFWTSLISSLFLFLFLVLLYISTYTFEFSLIEIVINYTATVSTPNQLITLLTTLFIFVLIIFLKSGLVPLFIWKPTVFKGMSLHSIFFYITFYYYFILMFFVYIFVIELSSILIYNKIIILITLTFGAILLFFILIESHYFKSFLALSSILNTLLIFLVLLHAPFLNVVFCI